MHDHSEDFMSELMEVMFGGAHVISEIFWNVVFALALFGFSKAVALRKVHKYIDDKHGVKHKKGEY
jgi:hypothetical protein